MHSFQTRFVNMYITSASALAFLGLAVLCHASPLRPDIVDPVYAAVSRSETRAVDTTEDALVLPKVRARDDAADDADDTEPVGLKIKYRDEEVKTRDEDEDDTELIGLKFKI